MDDSQSPPEAESSPKSGKADARRATLRLRDAEIVATTRRDMFGDGSLLDALAGDPLPRQGEDPGLAADTTVSAGEAEPQSADPEAVAGEPPQAETRAAPDAAVPAAQAAEAEPAQSLDAIIDSFPAGLASQTEERAPPESQADDGRGSEAAGFAFDQAPPTAPERFQVSAIFEGLASSPPRAEDPQEEPEGDASLPEGNDASGEHSQNAAAPGPPAVPRPGLLRVPVFFQPSAAAPGSSGRPPVAAPAAEDAPGLDTGEPSEPSEPSSRPHQDAASTEPAPYPEPADWSTPAGAHPQPAYLEQARESGAEPLPEPLGWPSYPEPPGYQAADSDAPPLEPPSLVRRSEPAGGASGSPFPGPPAWPPFPEQPGSEARLSAPEPAGLPPYIELPAYPEGDGEHSARSVPPAFTDPQRPGAAPSFGEATPVDAPPFAAPRGMPAFADRPAAGARREVSGFPDVETSTPAFDAAARVDATSKIAAEANATAQVLDNLQRLLDRTVSPAAPQPAYPQAQPHHPHNAPFHLPHDEPMPFVREMTPMLPLPLPPPPSERTGSRNVYLLGFLTGLLLSVMAGAALYFLINTG